MVTLASNLEWARSQMAFTLGFHIILASAGVALPALMLIANYRGLRRGDQAALLLARRWSKVVAVTFAVGGGTETVLSFEFGLLWPAFTRALRRGLRRAVRDRGDLLLPRGDLRRDLHLRLGAAAAVDALLERRADRHHRPRRRVLGRRGQLLDEPAAGLHDVGRRGHRRRPAEGDLQPGGALRGAAHDPRRLPGDGLHRRVDLRGRDAARPA